MHIVDKLQCASGTVQIHQPDVVSFRTIQGKVVGTGIAGCRVEVTFVKDGVGPGIENGAPWNLVFQQIVI